MPESPAPSLEKIFEALSTSRDDQIKVCKANKVTDEIKEVILKILGFYILFPTAKKTHACL